METNEQRKKAVSAAIQEEVEGFFAQMQDLSEGDLEHLEEQVVKTSQQMGRRLLEGILDSRLREQRPVARRQGRCGHRQRLVGERPKELLTLVGPVRFVRPYYQCLEVPAADESCTHGEAPDDALWGVHERRTTSGVQREISYLCGRLTFEEAAESLCRHVPLGMSARQALSLMRPVGQALARAEDRQVKSLQAQAKQARSQPEERQTKEIERLYIELDGVLARMRRGSVPMEKEERQRQGDVYREIKAGAVFRAERGPKRSELVPGVYVDTPAPDSMRYVARRTAKGGFGWLLYQLALHGGLEQAQQVVVIGDGAPWIWHLAAEHFPGAVQIVDLYHAKEHVWEVAHAVFGRGTAAGTVWATQACSLLEQGQSEALVSAIKALPPIAPEPGQARSCPERAVDYFTTNAQRMRYPAFRAQGMHLGSGIAEAACKTIVSTRAKRSGMRWTPEGIDALLPLRTSVLNGAYESLWQQEYAA
ncbi:MAG: hypothetical protein NVSMB27_21280 [Ktedonobacteraceae bacterium]